MSKELVVVYLASPKDHAWLQWTRLDCLEASLKLLRKYAPAWPVVVFHEDYGDEEQHRLQTAANGGVTFSQISLAGQEQYYVNRRPENRVGDYGYAMMCRFFCGIMQAHPLVAEYDRYMRLDDDSYIMSPLTPEIVGRLLSADYACVSYSYEPHEPLWQYTLEFLAREGLKTKHRYTGQVPYNNFHVASLALWRHPVIQRFLEGIEARHAYLREGWFDASIHGIIFRVLCPLLGLNTHAESGFDYRHNQHCAHHGRPHGKHCTDGRSAAYPWGPPLCLE